MHPLVTVSSPDKNSSTVNLATDDGSRVEINVNATANQAMTSQGGMAVRLALPPGRRAT